MKAVSRTFLICLIAFPVGRMYGADLDTTLKGIEDHYNRLKSLQMDFSETYKLRGRVRAEKGTVSMRRPDRVRFDYSSPPGKLWIADGKYVYSYDPAQNVAEKTSEKEIDDLRTPLAFLLGNLHFKENFNTFRQTADGWITALPKSDKLPFTEVSFFPGPDFRVQKVSVKGQDSSVIDYTFDNERANAPVAENIFKFTPPPGVELVDSSRQTQ